MANYNGAAHIEAAIRSALSQPSGIIEVLVVDDASADDSLDIVKGWPAEDRGLRWGTGRNGGPAAARNSGLGAARVAGWRSSTVTISCTRNGSRGWCAEACRTGADIVADDLHGLHDDE